MPRYRVTFPDGTDGMAFCKGHFGPEALIVARYDGNGSKAWKAKAAYPRMYGGPLPDLSASVVLLIGTLVNETE